MKHFYLYIFILSCIIFAVSYIKTNIRLEGFKSSNNQLYILLGDSILKNDAYVSNGKSIESLLIDSNKNIKCYAQDHSKIVDIYYQVNTIPTEFNTSNTIIFLSGGGNDILTHYVDQNQDITDTSILKPMFASYKNLIKTLHTRLPNAKIVLLDIYYPDNLQYKQFHDIIKEWNAMIYEYASNPKNHIYGILRISSHLTQKEDFSFGIEPSTTGGKKIADLILATY
jgi:hypothetical protein